VDDLMFLSWSDPIPTRTVKAVAKPVAAPRTSPADRPGLPSATETTTAAPDTVTEPVGSVLRFPDERAARAFLRGVADRREGLRLLRGVVRTRLPVADVVRWDDETLLDRLAIELATGRVRVLATEAPVLEGHSAATPLRDAPVAPTAPLPVTPPVDRPVPLR
jgi:hypothetical protein